MAWAWLEVDGKKTWHEVDRKGDQWYYKDTDIKIDKTIIHRIND